MSLRASLFHMSQGLTRSQKRAIFVIIDMVLAPFSFLVVQGLPSNLTGFQSAGLFVAISGLAAMGAISFGLPRIKLNAYGRHALWATAGFSGSVSLGAAVPYHMAGLTLEVLKLAESAAFLLFVCVASRYSFLISLRWVLRQGQPRCRVLIYGAGDTGLQMALALQNHPRILPVAFLDDDVDLQAMTVAGLPVLSPARLNLVMGDLAVDRVLLAMPSAPAARLARITRTLQAFGLQVQALPSFAQLAGMEPSESALSPDSPAIFLGRSDLRGDIPNVDASYAGQAIFVSGAGGSVGSELCRQLVAHRPGSLVLYERSEIALYTIDRELRALTSGLGIKIIPVLGSVTDPRFACNTMIENKVEVVFHAAAYKHLPLVEANPVAGLENNVIGTRLLADAAVSAGASRFVLISTDKAVRPCSILGVSKRLAEFVVQDLARRSSSTRFSIVRFGNVLGSSGSVLPLFRDQIAQGGPITLTHDDVTRYFMTLAEAARLVLFAGALPQPDLQADVFVLDMGCPVRIRDLAERMIKAEGLSLKNPENPGGDIAIVITGLRPGEKLHEDQLPSEALLLTPHHKILRSKEVGISEFALASLLISARAAIKAGDQDAARLVLSGWIDRSAGMPRADKKDMSDRCDSAPDMAAGHARSGQSKKMAKAWI